MPDQFTLNVGALHDWLLAKWSDEVGVTDGLVVVPEDMTFGDFADGNLGRRVDDYVLQLLTLDLETDASAPAIGQPDGWTILVYPTDDEYSHGYISWRSPPTPHLPTGHAATSWWPTAPRK